MKGNENLEVAVNESKIVAGLERALNKFDRIILIYSKGVNRGEQLIKLISESAVLKEAEEKVLLLSGNHSDNSYSYYYYNQDEDKAVKDFLPKENIESILKLYYLYEFSNRIQVISDSACFGSLLEYVDMGILTMEEAVDALLKRNS